MKKCQEKVDVYLQMRRLYRDIVRGLSLREREIF